MYCEIACKRISHAVEQSKQRLFEPDIKQNTPASRHWVRLSVR